MKRTIATAAGVVLAALGAAVTWLLVAGATAAAGGPNPILLRAPHPAPPPSSVSTLTVTLVLVAVLLAAAAAFALLQRRADTRAMSAEVTHLRTEECDQEHGRKAA